MIPSVSFDSYNAEELRRKGLIVTEYPEMGVSIVRYHKGDNTWKTKQFGECNREDAIVRSHRSVVYSLATGLPLAVAPIRRLMDKDVRLNDLRVDDWEVTGYYDGTMINVFWNPTMITRETGHEEEVLGWTLSSRSKLHAACRFTSDRLFRDLFEDARKTSGMEYDALNREYCYTFQLLHPESRHVIPVEAPEIVLVQISRIVPHTDFIGNMTARVEVLSTSERNAEGSRLGVSLPATAYSSMEENLGGLYKHTLDEENAKRLQGWVIVPKSGGWGRIRIMSKAFEECLFLRGDSANLRTNFLRLMAMDPKGDMIRKYGEWYPEEVPQIQEVGNMMSRVVSELVRLYLERHVRKSLQHEDLPHWCRRPLWDLHGRYLRTRVPIRDAEVLAYFRDISPSAVNNVLKMWHKETTRAKANANANANPSADEGEGDGEDVVREATGLNFDAEAEASS